jgi:hypothetical protein
MSIETENIKALKYDLLYIISEKKVAESFFYSYIKKGYIFRDSELIVNNLKAVGITTKFMANFGGEGESNDYWSVYSFTKDEMTVYVQFDGYCTSYGGGTYHELFFVEPREVALTKYFKV